VAGKWDGNWLAKRMTDLLPYQYVWVDGRYERVWPYRPHCWRRHNWSTWTRVSTPHSFGYVRTCRRCGHREAK